MYPINHYHPLRPCWPVLSTSLSETLPLSSDWTSASIFSSGLISPSPARALGTVCARVCLRPADPLTSGELSERSQSGPVSNGTVGTAQSDAITAAAISAVSPWSWGHGLEASHVNNGGVGGSPESSSLQTRNRSNAPALIALHLWERVRPGVF